MINFNRLANYTNTHIFRTAKKEQSATFLIRLIKFAHKEIHRLSDHVYIVAVCIFADSESL